MPSNFESIEEAVKDVSSALKRRPLHHTDTGTGTTFQTFNPGAAFKLLEIRFHTAVLAAAETLTFTRVVTGAEALKPGIADYLDYTIYSNDLGTDGITSVSVAFEGEEGLFTEHDSIVPALSANIGVDRWGLEIKYELV